MITEENIKIIPYGGCHGPKPKHRKYGTYHQSEGPKSYITEVENNAPAMSERLWKVREQLTIAEKNIFDAIIELPPMKKREVTRMVSKYTGRSAYTVRWHLQSIMWTINKIDKLNSWEKV